LYFLLQVNVFKLFVVCAQALYVKIAEELFPCLVSLVFLSISKLGGDSSAADFEAVWSLESIRRRAAEKLRTVLLFLLFMFRVFTFVVKNIFYRSR
jgi:hypothetical protein